MNDEDQNDDLTPSPSDGNAPDETQDAPEENSVPEGEEGDKPGKKSAEARINELIATVKSLEQKLEDRKEKEYVPAPPAKPAQSLEEYPEEVQKAAALLEKVGFVKQADVDRKIQEVQDRAILDAEHMRLEARLDGSDGRPAYSRTEIEDYMRKKGIYDAEAAYEHMFKDELLDWNIKKLEADRKKKPYVQRPGSSPAGQGQDQSITREKVAESLKTPKGREWYERNRSKILELMAKGQL